MCRFAHCLFKCLYFTVTTPMGVMLFRNEDWVPGSLFGVGKRDLSLLWEDFPLTPHTPFLLLFYNWELGYHLHSLAYHIFSKPRNDFYESLLHHLCSVFLMVFSYVNNCGRIGVLVLLLHDVVDIFMYGSKCLMDLQNQVPAYVTFAGLIFCYAKYRLWVFPSCVIVSGIAAISIVPDWIAFRYTTYTLLIVMLLCLFVLHVYWFYLILCILKDIVCGREAKDIHSVVE